MSIPPWRRFRAGARSWAIVSLVALAGCTRDTPPHAADSTQTATPAILPDSAPPVQALVSGWNRDAGAALLVPGEEGVALVVVPGEPGDSATDRAPGNAAAVLPADVALFTRAGSAGHAQAIPTPARTGGACTEWPTARVGPASGADALPSWTVGFVAGNPSPLSLDSIETAAPSDSATLAASVARLAGALGDDTLRALRGVPFLVRSANRFTAADGVDALVAVVERTLNQEATPLRERILIVAERPHAAAGSTPAPWVVAYHERTAGREEDVTATEVLAAVTLGTAHEPTLVLARALASGTRYTLLDRTGEHVWRARWTSVVRGC